MNKFLIYTIFFFLPFSAFSLSISGRVISAEDSAAIEYARVVLVELNKFTFTNDKGEFNFKNIPAGKYSIAIYHVTKEAQKISVTLTDKDIWIDFKLSNFITKHLNFELSDYI